MNFVLNVMNSSLKMTNFVFNMMVFVLKMMDFVFKVMDFLGPAALCDIWRELPGMKEVVAEVTDF